MQLVVSLAELAQDVAKARLHERPTIGITNGCYDLLHPGHVAMIEQAASLCDLLVVGVDMDGRVGLLKGEGRPFLPWADRCSILGGLRAVWRIVGLDTADSLAQVMQRIRPDRYFCRGDEAVPERAEAERLHVFVMALQRHGPWSATSLANHVADRLLLTADRTDKIAEQLGIPLTNADGSWRTLPELLEECAKAFARL